MELLRCTQCKGDLELSEDGLLGRCVFCGTTYHFKNEKNARLISLLNQANVSRLKGDYESAILAYQIALKEDETDADAYWGIVLSTYGIDYVEDKSGKFTPTCRRTIKTSILEDLNYKNAIKYASKEQAKQFESQAKEINDLQNKIKEQIKYEQDYDVFICFKSTDENGNPTRDRFIARQIYDELSKRNIRVFFSEVSLKGRLGEDYEPIIYKALYSCKFFILVATNTEFIQSPWLRNEWTRFRDRAQEENLDNRAFVVYDDLKENELPPIFRKQGVNLAKYPAGGYEIEIADGLALKLDSLNGIKNKNENYPLAEDKIVDLMDKKLKGTRETFQERLDRATGYFDIGSEEKAFAVLEETIDLYPRKSIAWWTMVCFLTDNFEKDVIQVHKDKDLESKILFNYDNALRFASINEKDNYEKKSSGYLEKLKNLDIVDNIVEDYERDVEKLFEYNLKKEKITSYEDVVNTREYQSIKESLVEKEEQESELTKHINKKSYYIKNLPKQKSWFCKFLNFVSFIIYIVVIIISCVKIGNCISSGESVWPVIISGIALLVLGSIPNLIAYFTEKKRRLNKVKSKIENDEKELVETKKKIQELKNKILDFNNQNQDDEQLNIINSEIKNIENDLNKNIQMINNYLEYDYIEDYLKKFDKFEENYLDEKIVKNVEKINEFESECAILKESNNKKIDIDKKNKPKYYDEKYEQKLRKSRVYINENKKYINLVQMEIDKVENEIKLLNFKKKYAISKKSKKNNEEDDSSN